GPRVQMIFARRMWFSLASECAALHRLSCGGKTLPQRVQLVESANAVRSQLERAIRRVDRPWQSGRLAGEVCVHPVGSRPPLCDGPDDERLPTAGVPGDEDARHSRHVGVVATDVAALVQLDTELLDDAVSLRADEAHRKKDELRRQLTLGPLDGHERTVLEPDLADLESPHVAVLVAEDRGGADRIQPIASLLVRGGDPEDHRVG